MMNRLTHSRPAFGAAALLLAGALAACSDTSTAPRDDDTLARQVAALGFRADMIEDHGEFVLVEGDIYLSKAQLRSVPLVNADDPLRPSFQYRTTNLVGSPKVHQITVDVSGLASQPDWQTAAREALVHWSGIANSYVQMVEGGPADIIVAATCTSSNVAAYASFPNSGNPGSTIYVNSCFGWSTTHAQKVHNMVHEFGHTLGLRHTNWQARGEGTGTEGAVHVPGTPTGNDNGSVMNGGTALNSWAGFSTADRTAAATLYPLPTPVPSATYPGGQPTLAWASLVGATSYTVRRVTRSYGQDEFGSFTSYGNSGTVSNATSPWVDTYWTYTGSSLCYYDLGDGYWMEQGYGYVVDAHFLTGTTSGYVDAEVAPC